MLSRTTFIFLAASAVLSAQAKHPDLSGIWAFGIDLPPIGLAIQKDGKQEVRNLDQSARHGRVTLKNALFGAAGEQGSRGRLR